jgi:arylsulfatase A-like enzyme
MNRRTFLKASALAAGAWAFSRTAWGKSGPAARPNIVYILADDLGYGDVSCLNPDSKIATPNMDRLARAGVIFSDAHSGSAVCTPTRYGILTGRYCWRSALKKGVLGGYSEPLLEPGRMTVATLLRQRGYATACVGKWHLGLGWQRKDGAADAAAGGKAKAKGKAAGEATVDFSKPLAAGPHTVGFDYSYIIPASLDMDPYVYIENGKVVELPTSRVPDSARPAYWRGGLCAPGFKHGTVLLELTKKAEAYVDERGKDKAKPFFLYLSLSAPHTPHVPREEFRGKSKAGNYGDFVQETDWTVGRILDAIERNGLAGNTLVIMTSDNGSHTEPLKLEEQYGHRGNYLFRGQKSDAWDGGHRIPFIARWPGKVPAGSTSDQTLCLTDLLATCAAIVGGHLPDDAGEDSYDILPALVGTAKRPIREATVHHSISGEFAIRQGPWKLVLCKGSGGWSLPEKAVPAGAPPMQLYHMQDDPREQKNLYNERPEIAARLKGLLEKYERDGRSVPPRGMVSTSF